MFMGCKRNAWW